MNLSKNKFEQLLDKDKLVLSFIGMSNVGKTYWSEKLSRLNFKHFNCDDLIEKKLARELSVLGYSGIHDVSSWMGQPYDERFARNQRKYLNFEKKAMKDIFKQMKDIKNENIVIDTTGSFVHLDDKICRELKKKSLVVYIQATNSMQKKMFERYIKNPKPVVFGDTFIPKKGETDRESLERCYPKLLHKRSSLYAKYADVIIPCESIDMKIDVKDFIKLIEKKL